MKKLLLLSIITITTLGANAQNVNIPDTNFKAYLLGNTAINTDSDPTEISITEASAFTGGFNCTNLSISDLTGIEAFTALSYLFCYNNSLTSLDVTQNTALTRLYCYNNSLTSLDVIQNTALTRLYCQSNSLTSLDLSQNTVLAELSCGSNLLESLNVANGNNSNMTGGSGSFNAIGNSNLTCIQVDDIAWSTTNWTNIDAGVSFSTNCVSLGINEQVNNINLSIYPNPTSDNLTIDTEDNIESIIIVDIMGKQVKTFIPTANTIDVSSLVKGIYFLQIPTANGIFNNRFIKR